MRSIIVMSVIIFLLSGCSPIYPVQKRLTGLWIIERIENAKTFENERFKIGVNTFLLEEDKACRMPQYNFDGTWTGIGKWDCKIQGVDTILIFKSTCKCSEFEGEYLVHFSRDESRKGMSILELRSDKFLIISSKYQLGVQERWK